MTNTPPENSVYNPDTPIKSSKDDLLRRTKFAHALAKQLLQWKDEDSIVIGLHGEWGSGKSSIINLVKEFINAPEKFNYAISDEDKPTVIEFNPWYFSGQDQLIQHFFGEVGKELEYKNESEKDKELAGKFGLYAKYLDFGKFLLSNFKAILPLLIFVVALSVFGLSIFGYLEIVRIVGIIVGGILSVAVMLLEFSKGALEKVEEIFLKRAEIYRRTLGQIKDDLKHLLLERGKKILIILDDIDRLTQDEIKQMLQLIKLNADFPNIIYLLSFDRDVVERSIGDKQKGIAGEDYLQKIVQIGVDLPKMQNIHIQKVLTGKLDMLIESAVPENYRQSPYFDQTRWGNIYIAGLRDLFENLRQVYRFVNSLSFYIKLYKSSKVSFEVNIVDFIAIESIRVFAPDLFNFMKNRRELFTATESSYVGSGRREEERREQRKQEIDSALKLISNSEVQELVKKIVFELFPQVKGLFGNVHYGNEWQAIWGRDLRVCATETFDRYFIFDNPENDISQFEREIVLSSTGDQESFEGVLREFLEAGRISKLLEVLQDYTDKFALEDAENVVSALFNISDELPVEEQSTFGIGCDMYLIRIIYHYLKRFEDRKEVAKILESCIKQATGLYGPVQKISIEAQGHEEGKADERIVEIEDLEKLQRLCAEKIRNFASQGKLDVNPRLVYILYRWKEWDNPQEVKNYVKSLTKSDDGLLSFISRFKATQFKQSVDDYVSTKQNVLNTESLSHFLKDLERVRKRIEQIDQEKLSGEKKASADLFLKSRQKQKNHKGET